jgi:hypothetical protein
MDSFTKQSSEQFTITIDFSNRLGAGETISSYTLTTINNSTSEDVESTIVNSDTYDTTKVYINVKAGTNGTTYKFTILVTTSSSNKYEKDLLMKIIDI